jgi:hypothetical protein
MGSGKDKGGSDDDKAAREAAKKKQLRDPSARKFVRGGAAGRHPGEGEYTLSGTGSKGGADSRPRGGGPRDEATKRPPPPPSGPSASGK